MGRIGVAVKKYDPDSFDPLRFACLGDGGQVLRLDGGDNLALSVQPFANLEA